MKTDILDDAIFQLQVHGDLITAERIIALRFSVGVLDGPKISRTLVVVENDLLIEFVQI